MKKIKFLLFTIAVILISLCSEAQNLSTTIKIQAMDMATAFMKNDFNTFVKYMHPNIIAFAGGKEKMKTKMDSANQTMKLFSAHLKDIGLATRAKLSITKINTRQCYHKALP